jgi:hypothetical protein
MVAAFFEIVAILLGTGYALRALGSLANVIGHARLKDPAVIRAEFARSRRRQNGTRLVSFEVRPNSPKESSVS